MASDPGPAELTVKGVPAYNPVDAVMNDNKFAAPSLKFPADLGSIQSGEEPYIIFNIVTSVKNPTLLASLALNMPSSVVATYDVQYKEMEMGIDKLISWGKAMLDDFGHTALETLGELAANMTGQEAKFEQQMGKVVNPHMANLFKGVGFRPFTFNFDLVAKNAVESRNIREIIKRFKFHMSPDMGKPDGSNRYFNYPDNFLIGLFSPSQDYLFKISTCVLTNCEVDYGATSIPSFFADTGAPVAIKLSLTFKELEIMTKARINQGY